MAEAAIVTADDPVARRTTAGAARVRASAGPLMVKPSSAIDRPNASQGQRKTLDQVSTTVRAPRGVGSLIAD
jgi:hypothetical protein